MKLLKLWIKLFLRRFEIYLNIILTYFNDIKVRKIQKSMR